MNGSRVWEIQAFSILRARKSSDGTEARLYTAERCQMDRPFAFISSPQRTRCKHDQSLLMTGRPIWEKGLIEGLLNAGGMNLKIVTPTFRKRIRQSLVTIVSTPLPSTTAYRPSSGT
ncbi:hypothetical protein MPH_08090 [Macrophomina phaseolina MS6]|uniref:Uncharacterized protein n=1 Tax=Macrophomina phaseolina (strain MS6) TaxID=1126212 RepID=K2SD87_MACPH|nr:hypothetical protein MPH_08090 [Macrophomina phaseolina MS6]